MLYLWLIAFACARVGLWLGGPAVAAAVVIAALVTRRRAVAIAALAGALVGLAPPPEPMPLGVSGTLDGVVVSVDAHADRPSSIRLTGAHFDGRAIDGPIARALRDPRPAARGRDAVRLEAVLDRQRAYRDPSPFPLEPGPLRATAAVGARSRIPSARCRGPRPSAASCARTSPSTTRP
ncbi:MAG: hypothetical protein U1F43_15345 [Myxococcota bacterium]